jgi:RES domain-containing protein
MSTARDLTRAIAGLTPVSVSGRYYRVTSKARVNRAFEGSPAGGRWGPVDGFRVIYLGDNYDGVVIETHRHVTDTAEDPVAPPRALGLITCDVEVTNIVDLTTSSARFAVGLSDPAILFSEPQDPNTGAAYLACQQVAQAAHQLGRHGILVPSATHRGNTLALFAEHLAEAERPVPVGGVAAWEAMPADPRRLRIVQPMSNQPDDRPAGP